MFFDSSIITPHIKLWLATFGCMNFSQKSHYPYMGAVVLFCFIVSGDISTER